MASLYASFPRASAGHRGPGTVARGLGGSWSGGVSCKRRSSRRLGPWRGVILAALAYALAHAHSDGHSSSVVALSCGVVWGALRASLVPSLLAHLVWDILVLLWLPLDAR